MPALKPNSFSELQTRIGVVGDIHTSLEKLRWALSLLKEHAVDHIYATGDIVDGPSPGDAVVRACALLQETGVTCVLGNHDRWLLDNQQRDLEGATYPSELTREARGYLQSLPASVEVRTPCGVLLLGHGLGSDDMTALHPHDHGASLHYNTALQSILRSERHRFVVSGHTHLRMVRKLAGVTFINAGALHYTRDPCCLLLDFTALRAQFFDYHPRAGGLGPSYEL